MALALLAAPGAALAAPAAAASAAPATAAPVAPAVKDPAKAAAPAAVAGAPAAPAINPNDPHFKVAAGGYTPLKPVEGVGMPIPGAIDLQAQYSPNGRMAHTMHNWLV